MTIHNIDPVKLDNAPRSVGHIARSWRRVGNRIRGRVANLTAYIHGKKNLRDPEEVRRKVVRDCEWLAFQKTELSESDRSNGTDTLEQVLRSFARLEARWKHRGRDDERGYSEEAIKSLLQTTSLSEIFYVIELLKMLRIRGDRIEQIITQHARGQEIA